MAPELPGDPGEDDLPTPQIIVAPMASDDSSDNDDDAYRGYQPLSILDDADTAGGGDEQMEDEQHGGYSRYNMEVMFDVEEEAQENGAELASEESDVEVTHGDPNLPHVESIDAEIERQVWQEPRPQELQIELDTTKTEQILSAMASFTLPNIAVPEWAAGVPEEHWKLELLQRIRQRSENERK